MFALMARKVLNKSKYKTPGAMFKCIFLVYFPHIKEIGDEYTF